MGNVHSNSGTLNLEELRAAFGERVRIGEPLAKYTAARLGGSAEAFLDVHSADDLAQAAGILWENDQPFVVLGGGSNVLVSDAGVPAVVLLNRAGETRFDVEREEPQVWAESGANLGLIARKAARRGLAGLEWAAGIPGTLGGAVVGNAGAHGGDIAGNLRVAEILHRNRVNERLRRETWTAEEMGFAYRSSRLKRIPGEAIVLSATLDLEQGSREVVQARINEFTAYRRRTQPPGASMGSMFKNPPGDFAGRLIEAAGLKGTRVGDAVISPLHANFFINLGRANARDVYVLIDMARKAVQEKFGITLELEIELLGSWTEV